MLDQWNGHGQSRYAQIQASAKGARPVANLADTILNSQRS